MERESVLCEVGGEFLNITYLNVSLQRVYMETGYLPYCFSQKSGSTFLLNVWQAKINKTVHSFTSFLLYVLILYPL